MPLYPVLVLHASFGKLTTLNRDMSANIETGQLGGNILHLNNVWYIDSGWDGKDLIKY